MERILILVLIQMRQYVLVQPSREDYYVEKRVSRLWK